ncbi:hypothetical protein BVY01_03300 [bacterium I07]|nr:hypothetical protein BVY01_03300 [bacterium I07]
MPDIKKDFYQKLRQSIMDWQDKDEARSSRILDYILIAPDLFHLLIKLMADKDVPITEKAKLAVAVGYFISPMDMIPELFFGPTGFLDDVVLASYALNGIINRVNPELILKHWAGEKDVLEFIQTTLSKADSLLGSGLVKRLKGMVK